MGIGSTIDTSLPFAKFQITSPCFFSAVLNILISSFASPPIVRIPRECSFLSDALPTKNRSPTGSGHIFRSIYERHTVMHWFHGCIGLRGKDYKTTLILIAAVYPCHEQHWLSFPVKGIFLLIPVPLIEPCGRNHNTSVFSPLLKCLFLQRRFTSGIENNLLSLKSRESPSLKTAVQPLVRFHEHRRHFRWMDVLCLELYLFYSCFFDPSINNAKNFIYFSCCIIIHIISATHDFSPLCNPLLLYHLYFLKPSV